jgi:nicotinamide-nucleotide amidase
MRVELVCIGTELLRGKVNTHGAYISTRLAEIGLVLARETTVSDDPAEMEPAFRAALERSDVVLSTGGLGPTFDDLTREGWSKVLGVPLERHSSLERTIRERFRKRGLRMPPENARQADVLRGARVIPNFVGTAPGQVLERKGKLIVLLPGPASEMVPMVEGTIIPTLRRKFKPVPYASFTLHTFGKPESLIDHKIRPVIRLRMRPRLLSGRESAGMLRRDEWINFCILAHSHRADVKAEARAGSPRRLKMILEGVRRELMGVIGRNVYGRDEETLESVAGGLLARRKLKLALAESCTGGLLAEMITRVPGSSRYFVSGVVAYSNGVKQKLLGVRGETLDRYGAVSAQAAMEMAEGASSAADIGVSITGIAGPSGGSRHKPVGLVFIGFAGIGRRFALRRFFHGTREDIRQNAAMTALDLLRRELQSPLPQ